LPPAPAWTVRSTCSSPTLAVYDVDAELLATLAPDAIVTQDLCRVCAVGLDDLRAAVARLAAKADVALVSPHPRRLGDILGIAQPGVQSLLGDGRQARVEGPERDGWSTRAREIGVRSSSNVDRSAPTQRACPARRLALRRVSARSRDVGFVIM
jgi:hypothetical protein